MNYKEIVFDGFTNPSSRKNIEAYFIRQFEVAKNEKYSLDEFFDGCLEVFNNVEKWFDSKLLEERRYLYSHLKDEYIKNMEGKKNVG